MGDRCTGHCCKAFVLPYSADNLHNRLSMFKDGHFVADMVIPLYSGQTDGMPADLRAKMHIGADIGPEEAWHIYTCRHFDGSQCSVYEIRPDMCRRYPYDKKCLYSDCEWDAARKGRTHVVGGHAVEKPRKRLATFAVSSGPLKRPMVYGENKPC